jgi:hypothetical protein
MKPLLLGIGVLVIQVLLVGGYFTTRGVAKRPVAWMACLSGTVLVSLFLFVVVKSVCHECLTAPYAAVCERRGQPVEVDMQSHRIGGYIKERQYAGCTFYWHENNTSESGAEASN